MPTATPTPKRPPIPAGDHILCLTSVEEKMQPAFSGEGESLRWIWQFVAKATDPDTGERYEFRQYTGPNYGHPKAGLTLLLDQMLPTWTEDQKGSIDTDRLLQTYYKAKIRHEKGEKPGDPPKARLAFIEPYNPKKNGTAAPATPTPAPAPADDEDEFDPFAAAGEH